MKQGKCIPHAPKICQDVSAEMQIIQVCSGGTANTVPIVDLQTQNSLRSGFLSCLRQQKFCQNVFQLRSFHEMFIYFLQNRLV